LLLLLLPRPCCLPRRKKLLEFNFLVPVYGAIQDGATKIRAAKNEMSGEQTVECEVAAEGRMAAREPKVNEAAK